jgi:hypothetical protein
MGRQPMEDDQASFFLATALAGVAYVFCAWLFATWFYWDSAGMECGLGYTASERGLRELGSYRCHKFLHDCFGVLRILGSIVFCVASAGWIIPFLWTAARTLVAHIPVGYGFIEDAVRSIKRKRGRRKLKAVRKALPEPMKVADFAADSGRTLAPFEGYQPGEWLGGGDGARASAKRAKVKG